MSRGFTLIELMLVIGILTVLLAISVVAINPLQQFSKANNTKRGSDVVEILNAIGQYSINHAGNLPTGIPSGTAQIIGNASGQANICSALVPTYLSALPVDPKAVGPREISDCLSSYNTRYSIVQTGSGRITVNAPDAELGANIAATR